MKKVLIFLIAVLMLFSFSACGCDHEWKEATCISPKICVWCDKTEGKPSDKHDYFRGYCEYCKEKDPDYNDLSTLGYTNNYGMNVWVQIDSYSFGENYVKALIFDVRTFESNYVEKGGVYADYFDYFINDPCINITNSSYFKISNREQCKYLSNDSISIYDDGFWEQSSIFERVVNANNSKLVIKTLNHNSDEVWFVPCDLLDFTTTEQIDDRHFYIEFKE